MKMNRRTFLAGTVAAGASLIPAVKVKAAISDDSYATLIDLAKCDGCEGLDMPACVGACRVGNADRFPNPDPEQIRDYWPQKKHEDWSDKKDVTNKFTPYNWIFVQQIEVNGRKISVPRRCMHCDNPPCAKICPFGIKHKTKEGPVYIDQSLCFGGAKCRTVCPWSVPQRQAGVGIYTYFQKYIPAGGGVMFKCDLCRSRLQKDKQPFCIDACPKDAMQIGKRKDIYTKALALKSQYKGDLYGMDEHGGTSTVYVSPVPFKDIDDALVEQAGMPSGKVGQVGKKQKVVRMHKPKNMLEKQSLLAKTTVAAPLLGALGAFVLATKNRTKKGDGNENS